jgi:hypothetical protein
MSNAVRRKALGILSLADPHSALPPPPRGFDEAEWFAYPTIVKAVPGAWAREVVGGNLSLTPAFVAAARELEAAGACAITADCGYAIAHQEAVRDAVSIPVACSSLLQLPLLRSMLPKGGRIGLLCFDASQLERSYLEIAGLEGGADVPIAIGSIQGTKSWENWIAAETTTDWPVLEDDVRRTQPLEGEPRHHALAARVHGLPALQAAHQGGVRQAGLRLGDAVRSPHGSGHGPLRGLSLTPALPALGVIELANRPLTFQGCLGNARSFPYPVLYETAQGAYVKRIVDADPLLSETYCAAAERLERRGATAIMATCGFAAVYQQAVAARTKLPVLLSPLLLLPLLLHALPAGRRLAILTYDSRQLDVRFLR